MAVQTACARVRTPNPVGIDGGSRLHLNGGAISGTVCCSGSEGPPVSCVQRCEAHSELGEEFRARQRLCWYLQYEPRLAAAIVFAGAVTLTEPSQIFTGSAIRCGVRGVWIPRDRTKV